jgi:hypothetical protein
MVRGLGRDSEMAGCNFIVLPSCLDGPSLFCVAEIEPKLL